MKIKNLGVAMITIFSVSALANTVTNSNRTSTRSSETTYRGMDTIAAPNAKVAVPATTTTTTTNTPTVVDQTQGTTQDVEVTRQIREELNNRDNLSTSAKNIEVITLNNTVTLRGAVASASEKQQVVGVVQRVAGNKAIRNELTIK